MTSTTYSEDTATVKVGVRFGDREITVDAPAAFIGATLDEVLDGMIERLVGQTSSADLVATSLNTRSSGAAIQMTTSNIAAKLNARTGSDLAIAAAAKLTFVDGRDTFQRQDILTEMKSAPSYHKESYRKNLSRILESLIKDDKLREVSADRFAIEARSSDDLSARLNGTGST